MILDYPFTEDEAKTAHDEWGCNCGPAALAFALQRPLSDMRGVIPEFEKRRYTSPTMMQAALRNLAQSFVKVTFGTKWQHVLFDDKAALVRVQWTGPWTAPGANPKWAYRQTHWIATWQYMEERGVLGQMQFINQVFDINGGIRSFESWKQEIVPLILKQCVPRSDGGWFPTHIWRLEVPRA